jgi:hypothetical protein
MLKIRPHQNSATLTKSNRYEALSGHQFNITDDVIEINGQPISSHPLSLFSVFLDEKIKYYKLFFRLKI